MHNGDFCVYLTNEVAKKIGVKSPVRYNDYDGFGRFQIRLGTNTYLEVDIFALYAVMLHYDGYDFELENGISTECEAYLQYLRKARLRPQEFEAVYSEFLNLEDFLRMQSISVYFCNIQQADNTASRNMKELSGQKSRVVETSYFWDLRTLPLLITRKKLPQEPNDDLRTIARNWGFLTKDDRGQGLQGILYIDRTVKYCPVHVGYGVMATH